MFTSYWPDVKDFLKVFFYVLIGIILFTASFYPLETILGPDNLIIQFLPPQLTKDSFWIILPDMTFTIIGTLFLAGIIYLWRK